MMGYETMRAMAEEAAAKARSTKREPKTFVGLGHDAIRDSIRRIPFLGDYCPRGWKRVDVEGPRSMGCTDGYLFVDASGCGARDEPALTVSEFVQYCYDNPHYGYAVVEAGQFQVVIAGYERRAPAKWMPRRS